MSKTKTKIFESRGFAILNDNNQHETDYSITKITDSTFGSYVRKEPFEDSTAQGTLKEVILTIHVSEIEE